ncbi:hypothetical protein ACJIZ3_019936 [Penstemon smallii]|uniref:Uncharacterized protein n=1 Tax=Penstemon smallii TaxID=265156 RepID=A0ABD3T2K3_9LAMI
MQEERKIQEEVDDTNVAYWEEWIRQIDRDRERVDEGYDSVVDDSKQQIDGEKDEAMSRTGRWAGRAGFVSGERIVPTGK